MSLTKKDIEPYLGMIVDIVPVHNLNMIVTLTLDKVDETHIMCNYWERFIYDIEESCLKFIKCGKADNGLMETCNCHSIKISDGFKHIQYTSDTDLGI